MPTLAQRLYEAYHAAPDRVAATLLYARQPEEPITYARLIRGAAGFADTLAAAGVFPGEVVILILQHGPALLDAFFGAILHGAVPSIMPFLTEKLLPEKYRQDLAALIGVTQPAAIVTYPEFIAEVRSAMDKAQPNTVRAVIDCAAVFPAEPGALAGLNRRPEDLVLLQHSSGTTGLQKGVALSHAAVLRQLAVYAQALQLNPEQDVIVSWLPLYHDMGLIAGFIMPLVLRVPLVLMSPFDWVRAPAKLFQAISHYHGTLSWLPNFAYNFCAQKIRERDLVGVSLTSWRAVINCSEPVHAHSHRVFAERFAAYGLAPSALTTCYAMAENVFAVTQGRLGAPGVTDQVDERQLMSERRAVPLESHPVGRSASGQGITLLSSGKPLPNVRLRVLDDNYQDVPERTLGEIALQSDCLLSGYFHRPDLTEKAFREGWYLTGDIGYVANEEVFITGRKKDLIIVGGKNVYPQDLERLAEQVAGVHPGRVVAFGIYDEEQGTEEVVVVAEAEAGDETERQHLGDEIRQRIARGTDVTLRHALVVGPQWLIKTSSGKMARAANRDKYLAETAAPAAE